MHPWGPYIPIRCACAPMILWWGSFETREGCYGITVDGDLTCPAESHSKCVAAGTCQSSCLEIGP